MNFEEMDFQFWEPFSHFEDFGGKEMKGKAYWKHFLMLKLNLQMKSQISRQIFRQNESDWTTTTCPYTVNAQNEMCSPLLFATTVDWLSSNKPSTITAKNVTVGMMFY